MSKRADGKKKIVFLTGTRADYGKLKSLMWAAQNDDAFEVTIFATGMHMLAKYGHTHIEIEKSGFRNIYKFVNQNSSDDMDQVLAKTVNGFGDYVKEYKPDLIVIHGDRVEALAGSIVGSLNNTLTAHIEGGEVSGTIDELIRHAVTKLSHIHFCSNDKAKKRLVQLGEGYGSIFVIGSPDIDALKSKNLPNIAEVKSRYNIGFDNYGILLFHPVTTDLTNLKKQIGIVMDSLVESGLNYVVIYPNNDPGSDIIIDRYLEMGSGGKFMFIPSMRFEYFLGLMASASFMVGNSSAGIIEAPYYGVPSINLGDRQHNRATNPLIKNVQIEKASITDTIYQICRLPKVKSITHYGDGNSAQEFLNVLRTEELWKVSIQKYFVDRALET